MSELNVSTLYDNADSKRISSFSKKRKSDMIVELHYDKVEANFEWLDLMESTMKYLDNILRNPNRFIINEEEIVKIELAKRVGVDSIKHLAKHTNLIQDINENDEITPSKVLNINKEETFETYENRFIYTLILNMQQFTEIKRKQLLSGSYVKDDKSVQYKAASVVGLEHISIDLSIKTSLHSQKDDGVKNGESLAARIDRLEQQILDLQNSEVFKALKRAHAPIVRPPIKKTNVILKNVNFQYALVLWNYLQDHFGDDVKRDKNDKKYEDTAELRGFFDDTFLLNYLALCTLNKEAYSTKDVKEKVMSQIIRKIIDLNVGLTEDELKDMVGEQFAIVRYRDNVTTSAISKVYRKHIDKYFNKINNFKLN